MNPGSQMFIHFKPLKNTIFRIHLEEGDIDLKLGVDHPVKLCATAKEIVTDNTFAKFGEVQMKEEEELKHYFGSVQPDQFRLPLQR